MKSINRCDNRIADKNDKGKQILKHVTDSREIATMLELVMDCDRHCSRYDFCGNAIQELADILDGKKVVCTTKLKDNICIV